MYSKLLKYVSSWATVGLMPGTISYRIFSYDTVGNDANDIINRSPVSTTMYYYLY